MRLFHQNTTTTPTTTTEAPEFTRKRITTGKITSPPSHVGVPLDTHVQRSTELISNGASILIQISIAQSKESCTTVNSIHGILMKMRSTINRIPIRNDGTFAFRPCCRSTTKISSIILMKIHLFLLIITLLTCASLCITRAAAHTMKYSSNVVQTKYGELRGIVVRNNPAVEAYLGVPYATPPVGSLR